LYNGETALAKRNDAINKAYSALEKRLLDDAAQDPKATLKLVKSDIDIIVAHLSIRANEYPIADFMSGSYKLQFGGFDTFLYNPALVSRNFYIPGGNYYKGGEINYLGIGVLAGRYGYNDLTVGTMVAAWNSLDLLKGKGLYNIQQIKNGGAWARYGRDKYER
jgi:hypothetical protein